MKHTNITNEIDGSYHNDIQLSWYHHLAFVAVVSGTILAILDQIYGAETVTNFIADLLGSLMG